MLTILRPVKCGSCAVDSSQVKVHQSAANVAGGQAAHSMGRTRGGLNTKIHVAVDTKTGGIMALKLSAGHEADVTHAAELLTKVVCDRAIADKAYDSDELREMLKTQGITPCIPARKGRKHPAPWNRRSYKLRYRVEQLFQKLKSFRRVATRYDKLSETFLGFVILAYAFSVDRW
jgi:transposase